MSRLSVHLVVWNSRRFLPEVLESLDQQSFRDFSVIVVDNASSDGVEDFLRAHYPQAVLLRNFKNLGFARAHNQAIELARSRWAKHAGSSAERYVLVMNPDVILEADYLERIIRAADERSAAGSFMGTVCRLRERREGEFSDLEPTSQIDTTGLKVSRTGRFAERGAGEEDRGQYRLKPDIFGVSGALALYRLSALEEAGGAGGEYFDEKFFAYKEDVDMAWRLRLLGWQSLYVPEARAYHLRSAYGSEKRSLVRAWRERRSKSALVGRLSYRNHFWLLLKNLDLGTFLRYSFFLVPYELCKFIYLLFFEPRTALALAEALAPMAIGEMLRKRRLMMARRRASPAEIRKWFG